MLEFDRCKMTYAFDVRSVRSDTTDRQSNATGILGNDRTSTQCFEDAFDTVVTHGQQITRRHLRFGGT